MSFDLELTGRAHLPVDLAALDDEAWARELDLNLMPAVRLDFPPASARRGGVEPSSTAQAIGSDVDDSVVGECIKNPQLSTVRRQ